MSVKIFPVSREVGRARGEARTTRKRITLAGFCALSLTANGIAVADDFFDIPALTLPSSVTVEGGGDAYGSQDFTISADIDLNSGNRLRGSYTSAQVEGSSFSYASDTYSAGFNSDPLATWSYGIAFEQSDRDDDLAADTTRGNVKFRASQWRIALYPELRYLTLAGARTDLRAGIRNPGLGAELVYGGVKDWSFTLKHFEYQYANDTATLQRLPVLTRYVSTRIGQEFNESQSRLAIDFVPSWGGIGVEWSQSVSAIDQTVSHAATLNAYWDMVPPWSVFARYGRSEGEGGDSVDFASGGVTYSWGAGL